MLCSYYSQNVSLDQHLCCLKFPIHLWGKCPNFSVIQRDWNFPVLNMINILKVMCFFGFLFYMFNQLLCHLPDCYLFANALLCCLPCAVHISSVSFDNDSTFCCFSNVPSSYFSSVHCLGFPFNKISIDYILPRFLQCGIYLGLTERWSIRFQYIFWWKAYDNVRKNFLVMCFIF